ncbi:unnamed protein product [Ectocarpus sp. CCAP 1310/34]|nr:unnamed protein product [Ectocarpus sp. CCAP 1310/34]
MLFLAAATAGSDGGSPGEVPPSGISSYAYSSFGSSSAYGAEYADLLAKFEFNHTPTDVGQGGSAYLVMLLGACTMAALAINMVGQSVVIFNARPNLYTFSMATLQVYFFIWVCGSCCYGSRTIRLSVLFSTGTRRAVPWLAPVRGTGQRDHERKY